MQSVKIDHLILGINDLQRGIILFEDLTGITPNVAGHHPELGTHNALVSLSNGAYLEIIAPKDTTVPSQAPFHGLERFDQLTPFGWAITVTDLKAMMNEMKSFDQIIAGPFEGTREATDGRVLKWEAGFVQKEDNLSINPFFSQWSTSSIHPSITEPSGCTLHEFTIAGKKEDAIIKGLHAHSLSFSLDSSSAHSSGQLLSLTLHSPNGIVSIGG